MLCVGGAREALLAEQDHFTIVLGRRLVRSPHTVFRCAEAGEGSLIYDTTIIAAFCLT